MDIGIRLFLNNIDPNTRENILGLDQKLKRLRVEINVKLEASAEAYLSHLINEVDQAINAIVNVVTLVSYDNDEARNEFLQVQKLD
jgi:hypothetical protein